MVNNNGLFAFNGNNSSDNSQEANTVNTPNVSITTQEIFDGIRAWQPNVWEKRLDFTKEQIATMLPNEFFLAQFANRRIGLTQDMNATRKVGIPALDANPVQMRQLGAGLAIAQYIPYLSKVMEYKPGFRVFGLLDTEGSHDIQVIEEANAVTGFVQQRVVYASKAYNHLNQVRGLNGGSTNLVHASIERSVEGYNAWVDRRAQAIVRASEGKQTAEDAPFLTGVKQGDNPNHFVQVNSVRHIRYESIVDKYSICAWLLAAPAGERAFEIRSFAKTVETTDTFLNGRTSKMVWGYQRQLESLSGFKWEPKDSTDSQ